MKAFLLTLLAIATLGLTACGETTDEKVDRGNKAIDQVNKSYLGLFRLGIDLYNSDESTQVSASYTDDQLATIRKLLSVYMANSQEALDVLKDKKIEGPKSNKPRLQLGQSRAKEFIKNVDARIEERKVKKNETTSTATSGSTAKGA
jgi:hypothetical protein